MLPASYLLGCTTNQSAPAVRHAPGMARRRSRLAGGRFWRNRAEYSPSYPYRDSVWRQLRPTMDAPACLIESQPTESGLLFGVAWSGTDRLTHEVNGTTVPHGRKAFVDPALARA